MLACADLAVGGAELPAVPYARGVEAVDRVLGVAEVLLIGASFVLLLRARSVRSWTMAGALTVAVAVTLAHPIGMQPRRSPQSQRARSSTAQRT